MLRLEPRRALFGAPLIGDALLKYAYVDEAGISAEEAVSVVVAVIVDADAQWKAAEAELIGAVKTVPAQLLIDNFTFSAKAVWGNPKLREGWADQDRLEFLFRIMTIPRRLKLPICMAFTRRGARYDPKVLLTPKGWSDLTPSKMDHLTALLDCVWSVENFMRSHTPSNEVATLIAEDVPELKHFIRKMVRTMKTVALPGESVPWVHRIIDQIQFHEKGDSPMLWLADACAFAFRRFLGGETTGDKFAEAVVGYPLNPEEWADGTGFTTLLF